MPYQWQQLSVSAICDSLFRTPLSVKPCFSASILCSFTKKTAAHRLPQFLFRFLSCFSVLHFQTLKHILNKNPIPLLRIVHKHMRHGSDDAAVLEDWGAAHALDDAAGEL